MPVVFLVLVFLPNGLHSHLSVLSELPLEQRLLLLLVGEYFPFLPLFFRNALFFLFFFLWAFFPYVLVRACCRRASTANTALQSAIRPAQTAKQLRADQSATTQASRQNWREPACRRASAARSVLKTNKEIEICPAYKNTSTHKA